MGLLGKIFYTTGKASARRPWTSIFIGLVIVAIGSLGFINWQSTVSFSTLFPENQRISCSRFSPASDCSVPRTPM